MCAPFVVGLRPVNAVTNATIDLADVLLFLSHVINTAAPVEGAYVSVTERLRSRSG